MADEKQKKSGILSAFAFLRGKWSLLLVGVLGLALLAFGGAAGAQNRESLPAEDTGEAYRVAMEAELTSLCRQVRGAGEVSVFLTLKSGAKHVYAEGKNGISLAGGKAILLRTDPPEIGGVTVVCTGGNDPGVRETLIAMLSATLGVGSNRIYITAKK